MASTGSNEVWQVHDSKCVWLVHASKEVWLFSCRTMNRRGMSNNDVASRVQGTGGSEDDHGEEEEEEGLYATYAMLHTIRKE